MNFLTPVSRYFAIGLAILIAMQSVSVSVAEKVKESHRNSFISLFFEAIATHACDFCEENEKDMLEKEEKKEELKSGWYTSVLNIQKAHTEASFAELNQSIKAPYIRIQSPPPKVG
ncbi:MAG: hypothetical protein MUF68_02580 [Cyclobacteriaceae bacterium]|jgi:thioredoxin-related protein|nr:hypothetical protein [Cyclobacteriaceae bacterium]